MRPRINYRTGPKPLRKKSVLSTLNLIKTDFTWRISILFARVAAIPGRGRCEPVQQLD